MSDLDDKILENAEGPSEATTDGVTIKQHSLKDQIEVDKYLNSKKASRKSGPGIKFNKIIPPGTL